MNLTADTGTLTTADRYIAAHREGKSIPANPPADLPKNVGEMSLDDCRPENLNPYTEAPVTGTVIRIVDGTPSESASKVSRCPSALGNRRSGDDAEERARGTN